MPFSAPETFNIPKRKPVVEFFTPVPESVFYSELVDNTDPSYQENKPMVRGRLYATIKGGDSNVAAANPNLYFLGERRLGNSANLVVWSWSSDEAAADSFNSEISYAEESLSAPIYQRIYRVRRDTFDRGDATLAFGATLKTILAIKVTAAGTGYTAAVAVTVANGATAEAVRDASGGISSIVLTGQGSDVTSAPLVTIIGVPADGVFFTVSGAGTTQVNGQYAQTGTNEGKPRYSNGDRTLFWDGTFWLFGDGVGGDFTYTSAEDTDYPWQVVTWEVNVGTSPSPTLTVASGVGAGATAVSIIQPQTAVLVSQKKAEFSEDSPWRNEFVRVLRVYETLPGPATSEVSIDPETNSSITKTRAKKLISAITVGAAIVGGNTIVVTDKADIDANTAWELKTTIPLPVARNLGTAVVSTQFKAQNFPGRINLAALDIYGTAIGYERASADVIECPIYTYWEISATKPTVTFDRIIPDTITINGVSYDKVLHDATVRLYSGLPVFIPATTPSYTVYVNSWIGSARLVDGEVAPTKYQYLWRIRLFKPTMR